MDSYTQLYTCSVLHSKLQHDVYCIYLICTVSCVWVCARTGVRESHGDSGSAAARAPRRHDRHGATLHSAVDAPPEPRARRRSIRTLPHSHSHSCRYRCIRHATPRPLGAMCSAQLVSLLSRAVPLQLFCLQFSPSLLMRAPPTPRRRAAALLCSTNAVLL